MRAMFALTLVLSTSPAVRAADAAATPTTLDVVVEDSRGRAIETLAAADFSVTEQSRSIPVESAQFVRIRPPQAPAAVRAVNTQAAVPKTSETGHVVAIYLDEFHVAPGAAADSVRAALIRFVTTGLDPSDRIVVLKSLDSLLEIRPVADRAEAVRKIEGFDPRRGDYEPRTSFERNFIAGTPARVDAARAQIATSSLEALATELGQLSAARKTLIVVSSGFTRNGRRQGDLLPGLDSVVLAANKSRVSIYTVDPSNAEPLATSSGANDGTAANVSKWREALHSLSEDTAGLAIPITGDVEAGLSRAFADSNAYYELTLAPDLARDGRFHAVDVTVRRPGLVIRARKGYFASTDVTPSWRSSIGIPAIPVGATIARRTSPLIKPWFGISKTADGETQVSFVWEPAPRVPGERNPPPQLSQIGLSVMTLDGKPVYEGVVLPSTAVAIDDPTASRHARASFVSPSGRLVVQMSIEDVTSRVVDRDVRDLEVKGFPGPVSMGTLQVLRARNAREYQTLAGDPEATPVASRQFSRTERLLVRVPVFSSEGSPSVSARLVTSFGAVMRQLSVSPTPSRGNECQVDVPLAALANGSYVVEVTARSGESQIRDTVTFRVTP